MNDASVALKRLAERVLGKGSDVPLAMMLELVVPVRKMRELARTFGLSPKGGFRVEKASAHVLAPLLADLREPKQLDDVLRLLLPVVGVPESPEVEPAAITDPLASLRDADLARLRDDLERSRESTSRGREREAELLRRLQLAEQEVLLLRRELAHRAAADQKPELARDAKNLLRYVHDLENEREGFAAADAALRRQLAHNQSKLRETETALAEVEALLPKGKRRRKPQPEPVVVEERRFLLPRFLPSFYKSLEGKERRAIERAFQAILLFCTEGHSYPGLEVKQMGGQDTWSLRASLGLRVYFRSLADGDIELLELGDREDQNTTLRRLKER